MASSSRRSSSTSRAPSSPRAARPQSGIRPASTARAPRASAVATSVPRRMPPSKQHLEPVADRVDDRRQRLERRHHAVELTAAVVRDDDARGAVLGSEDGILGVEHSLDDDRHGQRRGKPLQVGPVERRVEEVERFACRARVERLPDGGQRAVVERPVDPPLAVARADDGQVDGEEDGAEAGVDRLRDQLVGDAAVAKDVDLEEPRRSRALRPRPQPGSPSRTSRGRTPSPTAAAARASALLPVRMRHPLVGDRSHDDGRGDAWPSTVVSVETDSIPQRTRWRRRHARECGDVLARASAPPLPRRRGTRPSRGSIRASGERLDVGERQRRLHRPIISATRSPRTDRRRGSRPRTRTRGRRRGSWPRAPGRAC